MSEVLNGVGITRAERRVAYDTRQGYQKDLDAVSHAYREHPDFSYPCNVELPSGLWISMTKDPNHRMGYGFTEQEAVNNRTGRDNLDFTYHVVVLEDEAEQIADHVAEHMAQRRREREDVAAKVQLAEEHFNGEARKDDADKARYDLLPAMPVHEVVEVFTFGAKKYSDYNYRNLEYSRVYAAAQRHMTAWRMGEEVDEETGISHLAHACCCMLMLRDMQDKGDDPQSKDDR